MKITKLLIGSALAIPTVTVPLTTLSSCGSVWGYQTPYMIGSNDQDGGPYHNFATDTALYDADGKQIFGQTYLQSNYAIDVANSTNYAYATPMKYSKTGEGEADYKWEEATSGWYTSSDNAFIKSVNHNYKDGSESKTKVVTNARNAALSANTDFVPVIGSTINSYISLSLQYQATQLRTDDLNETDLKVAWGSNGGQHQFDLKHGSKGDEANRMFFEQLFAFSNLVGTGKVEALLRTSSVDFDFVQFPLPSYSFNGNERSINSAFTKLIEGNDSFTDPQYYSSKTEHTDDGYTDYSYTSVPVLINVKGLEQTYLNPTIKDKSFLVNDYYSSNKQITKAIGNSWKKNFPKFAGGTEDEAVPTYKTFTFNSQDSSVSVGCQDSRINVAKGNQFIALIDYSVRDYDTEDEDKKDTATLVKLDNVFPSFFLDILGDNAYKAVREDRQDLKIIDSDKINDLASTFTKLLKRESKEGQKARASQLNDESKHLLAFLGYLFSDGEDLNSSSFLKGIKM